MPLVVPVFLAIWFNGFHRRAPLSVDNDSAVIVADRRIEFVIGITLSEKKKNASTRRHKNVKSRRSNLYSQPYIGIIKIEVAIPAAAMENPLTPPAHSESNSTLAVPIP